MGAPYERGTPIASDGFVGAPQALPIDKFSAGLVGEVPRGEKMLYSGTDPV